MNRHEFVINRTESIRDQLMIIQNLNAAGRMNQADYHQRYKFLMAQCRWICLNETYQMYKDVEVLKQQPFGI